MPSGTTIVSITNSSTIVVSNAATAGGTVTATVFPWGNGDGSTTFNLPDLRGRTFAGADAMGGTAASRLTSTYYGANASAPAIAGGAQDSTIAQANLPNVNLPSTSLTAASTSTSTISPGTAAPVSSVPEQSGGSAVTGIGTQTFTVTTDTTTTIGGNVPLGGSGTPLTTIQPTLTANYIIKVLPNSSGAGGVVSLGGMIGDIVCGQGLTCAPIASVNTVECTTMAFGTLGCGSPDGLTITVNGSGVLTAVASASPNAGLTRAQIASTNTSVTPIVTSGYRAVNDLGNNCTYSSVGATSTGLMATRSASGTYYNLVFPSGVVNVGCFGAYGGSNTITSGDVSANPQWRGSYSAGQTWDYVAIQEAMYAAFAGASTPGSIVWNSVADTLNLNQELYLPTATYDINAELLTVTSGFTIRFESRASTLLNWTGTAGGTMWLLNSANYGEIFNPSVQCAESISYGSANPCWEFDHTGSSPGGLLTQQLTIYDAYTVVSINGQGVCVNCIAGGGGQGDTMTWINPYFGGYFSDYGLQVAGDNTLGMVVLHGDFQGFPHNAVLNNGGQIQLIGTHFENETLPFDGNEIAPIENQITTAGADFFNNGSVAELSSRIQDARSEDDTLLRAVGSGYTQVDHALITGSDIGTWGASTLYLPGELVGAGTKGRAFMLVETGGTDSWRSITSISGEVITDSGASYTTNQFSGGSYYFGLRYGSNGFVQYCQISSNTATTITVVNTCSLPGLSSTERYLVVSVTNGTAPSWDSASTGTQANWLGGPGNVVATTANSNVITGGCTVSVGDYVVIPGADNIAPGGSAPTYPAALIARVTQVTPSVTLSKNAAYSISGPEYCGTPLTDGNVKWINIAYDVVNNAPVSTNLYGPGMIAGPFGNIEHFTPQRPDWFDATLSGVSSSNSPLVNMVWGNQTKGCANPLTPASSVSLTNAMESSDCVVITLGQNTTFTAATVNGNTSQNFTLFLAPSAAPYTATFSTGFASAGTLTTSTTAWSSITFQVAENDSAHGNTGGFWQEMVRYPASLGSGITALTGDVTATGPGSAAATLATVNSSPGTVSSPSSLTVNAKGLVTAATAGPPSFYPILAVATNVNVNATGDTVLTLNYPPGFSAARGYLVVVFGVSGSISNAHVGLYTAASQGGTNLIVQTQLSSITAVGYNAAGAIQTLGYTASTTAVNYSTLYFNVGTAEGAAGTVNVMLLPNSGILP